MTNAWLYTLFPSIADSTTGVVYLCVCVFPWGYHIQQKEGNTDRQREEFGQKQTKTPFHNSKTKNKQQQNKQLQNTNTNSSGV